MMLRVQTARQGESYQTSSWQTLNFPLQHPLNPLLVTDNTVHASTVQVHDRL